MENLCHEEYPCLRSTKETANLGLYLPEGVEAVKMIIPKTLDSKIASCGLKETEMFA